MLLNFWYAVELSTHVTERPRKVRVLGQDLALYRDGARVVARAWSDPTYADWLARDATADVLESRSLASAAIQMRRAGAL